MLRALSLPRRRAWTPALFVLALAAPATGCPDTEERLNEFAEDTKDKRPDADGGDGGGMLADVSGTWLFALETVLGPGLPLQFYTTVEFAEDGAGGGTANFNFQPLSLDMGATNTPREPVGEPIIVNDVPVAADGAFFVDFGMQEVTGAANPVSGGLIVATIELTGNVKDENFMCGTFAGEVFQPVSGFLDGSTFAAERVDMMDPAAYPDPVTSKCPAE